MSAHTPGPWHVDLGPWHVDFDIVGPNGEDIGFVNKSDGADDPVEYPAEANARLVAAAPDLLAACEMLLDRTANPITDHAIYSLADARARAIAAIAKAEGR